MKTNCLPFIKILMILFFRISFGFGQNLVPNSSFEEYDICPNSSGQINYSTGWYQPTTGTPDYYNVCYDISMGDNYGSVPDNYMGSQSVVETGMAYGGIFACDFANLTSSPTFREYIQTQLTDPLIANQKYYVSLFVSLSDSSRFTVDDLGIYVSQTPIDRTDYDAFGFIPQIENQQGNYLSDKTDWMKISGSFIAQGNEQFITIGNFKNDLNTDTIRVLPNLSTNTDFNGAYYYVDNICLSEDSLTCSGNVGIKGLSKQPIWHYNSHTKQIVIMEEGTYQIQIIDLFGIIKSKQKLLGHHNVDVSNYSSGWHLIILTNQDGVSCKKIFINP